MDNYVSLDQVLKLGTEELNNVRQGVFSTRKIGLIPYSGINNDEFKSARKDSVKISGKKDNEIEIDDTKMMISVIISAVDKDKRSDFSFANKELLTKLGVFSAEAAVNILLDPGEVVNMATEIQDISGFSQTAITKVEDDVKNS
jgi:hypothetical protein